MSNAWADEALQLARSLVDRVPSMLSNALRCSPPDSAVIVRVRDWDEPLALVIEVANQGCGIASELVPRLFEWGARRHTGDASNPPGLGLGLYIVRRVMDCTPAVRSLPRTRRRESPSGSS